MLIPKKIKREFSSRDRKDTTFTGTPLDDVQCTATKSPATSTLSVGTKPTLGRNNQSEYTLNDHTPNSLSIQAETQARSPDLGQHPTDRLISDSAADHFPKEARNTCDNHPQLERRQDNARHLTRSRATCGTTPHWMDDGVRLVIDLDGFWGVYVGLLGSGWSWFWGEEVGSVV